jgi:hypothetical protein
MAKRDENICPYATNVDGIFSPHSDRTNRMLETGGSFRDISVVLFLPRPPNRVRKLLCNLRTLKPRRVNIAVQVLCSSRVYSSTTLSTFPDLNSNSIQHPTLMEGNIRSVRPYKKTLVITVPETPD